MQRFIEEPKTEDIPEVFEVDLPLLEPEDEKELEEKEKSKNSNDFEFL